MSFEAEKFIFGHIPKCGGTFIKKVSKHIDIVKTDHSGNFGYHAPIYTFNEELPILISVRHPYGWYTSQYNFLNHTGWRYGVNYGDFNKWFDAVVYENLTLTKKYYEIMGCCRNEDYVIKVENLRDDYIKFLYDIGYDISEREIQIIKKHPKENMSINGSNIELNSIQKEKVRQVDAEIFKRYSFIS